MRTILALLAPILIILGVLFYRSVVTPSSDVVQIDIGDITVFAEVADTRIERARGLMFRKSLDENEGMWFIFEEEDYLSFWMKNTLIPLDIIWVSENMEIVHIEKNVQPCGDGPCLSYKSPQKAKYVLEVNAGWAEEHNITGGQILKLQ